MCWPPGFRVGNGGSIDASGTSGGEVEIVADDVINLGIILADGTEGAGGDIRVGALEAKRRQRYILCIFARFLWVFLEGI